MVPFTIKILADNVTVRQNKKEIFIVQFTPTILLLDNKTNTVLYSSTLGELKGLSFQSYDKAYKEAVVGLNRELKGVADGIIKAIL